MRKVLVALAFLLIMAKTNAQITAGAPCSGATTIVPTFTAQTVTQSNSSGWMKFTASSSNMILRIKNVFTGVNAGRITNVNIYSGNCTTPVRIFTDTLDAGNDTVLFIGLYGITASQDYYIETIKNTFPTQCDNVVDCSGDAVFTIQQREFVDYVCTVISRYKSYEGCDTIHSKDIGCSASPCNYGNIPLCYTASDNSLSVSAGFVVGGIYNAFQTFDMKIYTSGSPSNYTYTSNSGTLASLPLLAVGPGPVTYTIEVYQFLGGPLCQQIIITIYPGADAAFTTSSYCAGQVCFTPAANPNNIINNWTILNGLTTYTSNIASPCLTLSAGTYTVRHSIRNKTIIDDNPVICGACTESVITISPPFTVTTSVSNPETCYGVTNTLGASAGGTATYTWYPGLQTTASITVVPPPGFTQYTVVAQVGACTQTALVGVTTITNAPTFTATLSQDFVCLPNNATTLTVAGTAGSQTLIPPAPDSPTVFTNTLALTPTVTANYTIAAYDNGGCLTYSVVKVGVVPCGCLAAAGTTVSGIVNDAGFTNYLGKIKVVGDVTLTPSSVGNCNEYYCALASTEYIVYPGVKVTLSATYPGTVDIIGSYFHGCGELWEGLYVPTKNVRVLIQPFFSMTSFTTSLIEDAKIGIEFSNLITPSLTPCNPTNVFLDAKNTTFNKNLTGVKISNYQTNQATYPFNIENCLFTSRSLPITSGLPPSAISSWPNTSTVKNSLSGNTSPLQTPYIDDATYPPAFITSTLYNYTGYPQYGIRLENVGYTTIAPNNYYGISIGQTGTDEFNCFDYLQEDINCLNSNLSIINSVFQNGVRYGTPKNTLGGKAIVGNSVDDLVNNINNRNSIHITGAGIAGSYGCRFYDKSYAIDLQNYYDVLVQNSNFYSYVNDYSIAGQANSLGGRGINIKTNRYYYLALQKNNFYNIRSAMLIGLDNAVVNINNQWALSVREIGTIDVNNNTVNRYLGSIPGGADPYVNIGLQISDPVAVPNLTFTYGSINASAMSNTLAGVNNGIYFNSLCNTPVSALNNSVSMVNATGVGSQIGINGVNLAKQASYHANSINGPASYSSGITGLYTSYNASLSVRCNTTSNAGRGIQFNGTEPTDFFEDNTMDNEDAGLVLDNGAVLANMAMPLGNVNRPTNNQWLNSWSLPKYMAYTDVNSNAQQSKLYIQYGVSGLDPSNSSTTTSMNFTACPTAYQYTICIPPIGSSLFNSNTLTPGCRLGGGGNGGGIPAGRLLLQQVVADSIHYETADSTAIRNVNKTFAYRVLQGNPLLMDTSTVLQTFYDTAYAHNPQTMVGIEEQLANGGMSVAGALLSSFTPVNAMESNYKSFYNIMLRTKDGSYNASDSTSLDYLCRLCPFTDGTVVYQARALYSILYNDYFQFADNCYGSKGARPSKSLVNSKDEIRVTLKTTLFPNPNSGSFVIRMNTNETQNISIQILDVTGKEVLRQNRQVAGSCELNLGNELENGLYLVKIELEDGTHDVHRLVISK